MSWLNYLVEANIYMAVFYLCYRLLLADNTHYTLSRIYLIGCSLLSFLLPLTQASVLKPVVNNAADLVSTQAQYIIPATHNVRAITYQPAPVTIENILPYLYIGGAIIAAMILMLRLIRLYMLTSSAKQRTGGQYKRVDLPDSQTAFSFFNYLYIGTDLDDSDTIIMHELVHIRQKHTLDILLLELLKVVNWFSPVVYLVQQSLKTLHEYIADEQTAARENDVLAYSSFLLNNAYGLQGAPITHSFFNNNLLKRRIIMLNQKRSGKLARLKYLAAVPLCAGMLCSSTLLFSKDYGLIDVTPLKKSVAAKDSANYTLKITDTKTGMVIISDKMVYTNPKTGENTTYTIKNFSDKKSDSSLTVKNFVVEKILRDTVGQRKNQQQLPPPPPPINPVKAPFQKFAQYLSSRVKYPESDKKSNKNGGVILTFTVNNNGEISGAQVAGKPGAAINETLKNTANQYNGKVNAAPGTYALSVHYMMLGHKGVGFPAPSVTKESNYVGEIEIVGMTDAQRKLINKGLPPPPPPVADRKKTLPPPPPPAPKAAATLNNEQPDKSLQAFYTHLGKTVRYPAAAFDSDKQGRVIVTFDVNNEKISNAKVVRGVTPAMDNEVLRALNAFDKPLALPAKKYSMPVAFSINKGGKESIVQKDYPAKGYSIKEDSAVPSLNEVVIMGYKN